MVLLLKCVHTTRDRVSILKEKKNTISKLILMRMLNIKQDKVGHKGLLLAKFGPENVNKHRLQNILVMLRTAATENVYL